jgi:hypothetical protein
MRDTEKLAVYPITRQQRSVLQANLESIDLVWAYTPHPLQSRYIAMALWQFDGEHEIVAIQQQLMGVMGFLMQKCAAEYYLPERQQMLGYYQAIANLHALLQSMLNASALFQHPA